MNTEDTRTTTGTISRGWRKGKNQPHPVIRIGGHYLAAYGFMPGDLVSISVSEHCIVIVKVP